MSFCLEYSFYLESGIPLFLLVIEFELITLRGSKFSLNDPLFIQQ